MTAASDVILTRMMTLHPKIIDLTLDRVWRLLAMMDHPERRLPPVIHVAGTNGKGSTQAMIRAGLEAGGDRVHAYTSPHLARFHERIRLAGSLISEPDLSRVLDRAMATNGTEPITYFEITTCAALLAMAETPADWTLLEVGLGGRLDATNVVEAPRLTIITPIDFDHEAFLGNTLTLIAGEKAGILKRGVPCIVGPQHDESLAVIEAQAARVGAPLLVYGQHWHVSAERGRLIYQDEHGLLDLPPPLLPGPHQYMNAGAAITALRHLGRDEAACEAAVTQPYWPARMQRMTEGRVPAMAPEAEIWLDGGHNPAGGLAVARTLDQMPPRPTYMICGMLNTKDIEGYLRPLAPFVTALEAVSIPGAAATLTAEQTASHALAIGMQAQPQPSLAAAFAAIVAAEPRARILLAGSLYFAGHVLRENE